MTVNKDRVRKLIAGLRSGEFEQCQATLTRFTDGGAKETHCCLGVATVIAMADGVELRMVQSGNHAHDGIGYLTYTWGDQDPCNCAPGCSYVKGRSASGVLPDPVMEYYGFDDTDPVLRKDNGVLASAVTLNDTYRMNFGRIADAFERTFVPEDVKS